ncbi:MAG: glycosyltransferase family 4 protein [Candidatus Symbiodolus clandestinus]
MHSKIAIITHRSDHRGGMERYALDIAYQLADEGRLAALITKSHSSTARLKNPLPIKSLGLRWLPAKLQTLLFSFYCYWYKKRHPEVILFACSKIFCSDIIACGGTHWGYLNSQSKKPTWLDRIEIFYEKWAYQKAICIVAHSPQMRQELIQWYGINTDKIITLYPPVDQQKFHIASNKGDRKNLLRQLNIEIDNRCVFLFPSSGHKRKGLEILSKAFACFEKQAILLIAGKKPRFEQSNVIALGYVSNMPPWYAACDYTILASTYEPFGLVALESILCGTPILLSHSCGCNAVLSETVRINFHAEDLEELKAVLAKTINNPFRVDDPLKYIKTSMEIKSHLTEIFSYFNNKHAIGYYD